MAKKRGKLSEVEKYYIVNHKDVPLSALAEQLNRTEDAIQKVLDEVKVVTEPEVTKTDEPEDLFKLRAGDFIAHNREATVMTAVASEIGDENRPKGSRLTDKMKNAIHKPRG
jgi:hypothetical protein